MGLMLKCVGILSTNSYKQSPNWQNLHQEDEKRWGMSLSKKDILDCSIQRSNRRRPESSMTLWINSWVNSPEVGPSEETQAAPFFVNWNQQIQPIAHQRENGRAPKSEMNQVMSHQSALTLRGDKSQDACRGTYDVGGQTSQVTVAYDLKWRAFQGEGSYNILGFSWWGIVTVFLLLLLLSWQSSSYVGRVSFYVNRP